MYMYSTLTSSVQMSRLSVPLWFLSAADTYLLICIPLRVDVPICTLEYMTRMRTITIACLLEYVFTLMRQRSFAHNYVFKCT